MPLSSAQIAQLNGAYTQQYLQNLQYSSMIQPQGFNMGGYNTRAQSEGMAAHVMNTASAVGAPALTLGMGMMGLDPLSMGMRAGAGAMGAGAGLGTGVLAGAAVGGGMMAGIGAIGYMGNQIMSGAQQTQAFNNNMRSSYSFFNPAGTHGRGFSGGDLRDIGGQIRGMSSETSAGFGELGPGFNELGRLAANMGRMGLADGVRNAKEFTEKFREMMKSVKVIAEDMGTTLEEAQKMMASMKGSGVFKNQAGVSNAIRGASVAGGLATTEVTGMMNIGSQISRMFGGTGKQGAMGGIKAIEQVGMAQQIGAVSEEDIYNATGQTGAEGRQSYAQQQMMQTGSFLKSSKGRWLLASLAGKNGNLDPSSVSDFMTGGMGVEDTRRAAHGNLAKVGRANFIRNEGRLRGAVMEQFGGLAPAMAMMGWAQGKGIDINSMGDREMLFMQRQLGMGSDETDALVKMARKLPELMQQRRTSREDDQLVREHGLRARDSGIEGIKRKLEAARDTVNNEMQKVGQDILNSATDSIAEWGNRIAGTYEQHSIQGIREAQRVAMMGGREGRSAASSLGGGKFIRDLGGRGTGISGPHEDVGMKNLIERQQDLQFAARVGTAGSMDAGLSNLVGSNTMDIKRAYADELSGLGGEDRMAAFKRHFGSNTELGQKFRAMSGRDQAAFMQQMEGQIGIKTGRLSETFDIQKLPGLVGGGDIHTEAQRQEAIGRRILGMDSSIGAHTKASQALSTLLGRGGDALTDLSKGAAKRFGVLGAFATGGLAAAGAGLKAAHGLMEEISGRGGIARGAGSMFDSAEGRRTAFDVLSGAEGGEERLLDAISAIKGTAAERGGMSKLTKEETGHLAFYESVQQTADLMKVANAKGGFDKMSNADWDKVIEKRKATIKMAGGDPNSVTRESIIKDAQGVQGMASDQYREITTQLASQAGKTSRGESQALQMSGIAKLVAGKGQGAVDVFSLSGDAQKKLMAMGGKGAVQAAQLALEVSNLGLQAGAAKTPEEAAAVMDQRRAAGGQLYDMMAGMDVKGLRALGQQMAGTSVGGQAAEMIMRGSAIEGSKRKVGAAGAIAGQLGLQLGQDELAGLKGMGAGAAAAALAARLGVGGDKGFTAGLEDAIAASMKKGGGIQGGALLTRAVAGADNEDTKKKLEQLAKGNQSPDEKIIDKLGEGNDYLKALVDSNKAAKASLDAIRNNTSVLADAEK